MISLNFHMVLTSLILSLFLGSIGAVMYSFLRLLAVGFSLLCTSDILRRKRIFNVTIQFLDFFFIILMAIAQILVGYVSCDGVVTLYALVCTVIAFFLICFLIERPLRRLFEKIKSK